MFRLISICLPAIVCVGLSQAATMSTFTFTGDCEDCTGQGTATLVLQNYTQGDPLELSNFVSFSYMSNLLDIQSTSLSFISGTIPVDLPGPADVELDQLVVPPVCNDCNTYDFRSQSINDGDWDIGVDDEGINGVWAAAATSSSDAPEPAPAVMLGLGIAALAAWKLRRSGAEDAEA
jgi:hypothetical protein